jgi:hypothetical protein
VPFRVFGVAARPSVSPPQAVLLWNWLLVQSSSLTEVLPLLVKQSRFFVGSLPRTCGLPSASYAGHYSASSRALSSSFTFLESVTHQHLVRPPQQTDSSHGLLLPTAHQGSQVHLSRVCRPATFRLQGLVTLVTAYSLQSRAGFVSHRQRSWDSPFGGPPRQKVSEALSPRRAHVPFGQAVFPPPKRRAGPKGPGFWALTLPRVPLDRAGF